MLLSITLSQLTTYYDVKESYFVIFIIYSNNYMRFVIVDSNLKAGDNGEYFYEYMMKNHPDVHLTFVISKNVDDYKRLKEKGFNVMNSYDLSLLNTMRKADFIFFSKFQNPASKIAKHFKNKCVFLNHGVSNKINNVGFYFGKTINDNFKYVCCTSKQEKDVLMNDFNMKSPETIITGFARWDSLIRKNNARKKNDKPHILITFHWRHGDLNNFTSKFTKSEYLTNINKLLNSDELHELSKKCHITFMHHAMFYKYKDLFKVPKYIEYGTNLQFQDLLVEADAIVTDFSSNAYEMAVIGKPCFYYIPDVKYVQENMKQYNIENFEKYSIGKLCNTQKELLDTLDLFADGKYEMSELNRRNINSTFDFIDDRNCERIYEFVKSIYNKPK